MKWNIIGYLEDNKNQTTMYENLWGQKKNSWSHILKLLRKKINITELKACVSVVKSSFYEIQRRAALVMFFW